MAKQLATVVKYLGGATLATTLISILNARSFSPGLLFFLSWAGGFITARSVADDGGRELGWPSSLLASFIYGFVVMVFSGILISVWVIAMYFMGHPIPEGRP